MNVNKIKEVIETVGNIAMVSTKNVFTFAKENINVGSVAIISCRGVLIMFALCFFSLVTALTVYELKAIFDGYILNAALLFLIQAITSTKGTDYIKKNWGTEIQQELQRKGVK